ncbi:MAG TPA: hypothetical protein VHQ47_03445 [Phycisphaerae bacterium]|jgi:hypothetical protein|nr:hypothetical protein [Phycisphaerae bacterium]
MRAVDHPPGLGREQLQAMAAGDQPGDIDDMEFLETLARRRCMLMPPWVYHIGEHGKLEKVTPVRYGADYNLDKPSILLAVMDKVKRG